MKIPVFSYILSLSLFASFHSHAQSIEDLNREIEKAQKEIELSQKLLINVHDQQKSGETSLRLLQSNITNRKKIVYSLDSKVKNINSNIYVNNREINHLKSSLKELKSDYSAALVNRYKDLKLSNFLLFLFSSDSFYQMNLRSKYLEQISHFTQSKSELISSTSAQIAKRNNSLTSEQQEIKRVLSQKNSELSSLSKEQSESKQLLSKLTNQEKNLNSTISKNSQLIGNLQSRIKQIVEEEMRKKTGTTEDEKRNTIKLSANFTDNRGKFPPPIKGVIISRFGLNSDPLQKNIKIRNNGVNITPSSSSVRCIYDGVVVKVFFFQGLNNSIMVRHGDFLTVYSNLSKVNVEQGDRVKTEQKLGVVNSSDTSNIFHFEIWENKTALDPEKWINF